jgi:hypothetical protein
LVACSSIFLFLCCAVAIDGGESHAALTNSSAVHIISVAPSLETKVALVIAGGVLPIRLSTHPAFISVVGKLHSACHIKAIAAPNRHAGLLTVREIADKRWHSCLLFVPSPSTAVKSANQASSSSRFRSGGTTPPLPPRSRRCPRRGLWSSSQSHGLSRKTAHQGSWWRLQGGSFLRIFSPLRGSERSERSQRLGCLHTRYSITSFPTFPPFPTCLLRIISDWPPSVSAGVPRSCS